MVVAVRWSVRDTVTEPGSIRYRYFIADSISKHRIRLTR